MSTATARKPARFDEVELAEKKVKQSSRQFEEAIDHLEEKIEDTSMKVQHIKQAALRPKEVAQDLYTRTRETAEPYIEQAKIEGVKLVESARRNPVPFIAGGVLAAVATLFYFLGRRSGSQDFRDLGYDV